MARIYKSPAPSVNKAAHPVVETKTPKEPTASVAEPTAEAPASTDEPKGRGRPKKNDGE
jgi:hypothetical protein